MAKYKKLAKLVIWPRVCGRAGELAGDMKPKTRNWQNWCFAQGYVAKHKEVAKLVNWPGPLEEMWS